MNRYIFYSYDDEITYDIDNKEGSTWIYAYDEIV